MGLFQKLPDPSLGSNSVNRNCGTKSGNLSMMGSGVSSDTNLQSLPRKSDLFAQADPKYKPKSKACTLTNSLVDYIFAKGPGTNFSGVKNRNMYMFLIKNYLHSIPLYERLLEKSKFRKANAMECSDVQPPVLFK